MNTDTGQKLLTFDNASIGRGDTDMNGVPVSASRTETAIRTPAFRRHIVAAMAGSLVVAAAMVAASAATDTRTLDLYNNHTKERLTITFKKNGHYIPSALTELNRFLRDWRRNESITMDPRLFDTVWELHERSGSRQPIHVVCGYRSLATNNLLRSRSSAVAKHSQHTLGKAMDLNIPDVSIDKLRAIGVKMQNGGVGWYPSANSPFVHIDVGNVRAWPRLTRTQLVALFPDGKTAHIPADGKPLPGYKEALAEIQQERGIPITTGIDPAARGGSSGKSGGLLAMLFGGGEEDTSEELQSANDDDDSGSAAAAPAKQAPAPVVARAQAPAVASAPSAPSSPAAAPSAPASLPFMTGPSTPAPVLAAAAPIPAPAPARPMTIASLADATLPPAGAPVPVVNVAASGAMVNAPLPPARPDALGSETTEVAALDVPAVLPPVKPAQIATRANASSGDALAALAQVADNGKAHDDPIGALAYSSSASSPIPSAAPQPRTPVQMASTGPAKPVQPLVRSEPGASSSLTQLADAKSDMLGGIEAPLTTSEDGPSLLDGGQSVYWGHFTSLTHPDQRNLTPLFAAPVMVANTAFSRQPYGAMVSTRFSGKVIPPNNIVEFVGDNQLAMR